MTAGALLRKANIASWAPYLVAIVALVSIGWAKDFYEQQLALVFFFAIAAVAWNARHTYRIPLVLLGAYLASRALYGVLESRGLERELWLTTSVLSLRATAFLFALVAWATAAARGRFHLDAEAFFSWAVPIAAVASMVGYPLLGANLSLNAALLVACLPFVPLERDPLHPKFKQRPVLFMAAHISVAVMVFFFQGGGTAPVMLGFYFALRFFGWIGLMVGTSLLLAKLYLTPHILDESVRLQFYELAMHFFFSSSNNWIGNGLGSFVAYGPLIQTANNFTAGGTWLSMHSDWLQAIFELGNVGNFLIWMLISDSVCNADKPTGTALFLLGICAIGYFPLEVPIMAALGAWLIVRSQLRRIA